MKTTHYLLVFLLSLVLTSCSTEEDESAKIVVMLDLHGSQSSIGQEAMNGFLLGWQQGNEEMNSKMFVSVVDTRTDMGVTEKVANLTAPQVVIGTGFTDNNSVLAAGSAFEDAKVPFLSLGATDPSLPERFDNYIFLVPFGDNTQAAAAAEFAIENFGKNAAVIWDSSSEYSRNLPQYFVSRFKELKGNVLYDTSFPGGCATNQIANNLSQLNPKPDFIYLAALPECVESIIQSIRDYKIDLPIIGGDGLDTPNLTQNDNVTNVWYTTHSWDGSERSQLFIKEYKETYYSAPVSSFAALGYDTAKLITQVLKHSQSFDPEDIIDVIQATQGFEGVTGTISYSKDSRVPKKSVWIIKIENGNKSLADHLAPQEIPPALTN